MAIGINSITISPKISTVNIIAGWYIPGTNEKASFPYTIDDITTSRALNVEVKLAGATYEIWVNDEKVLESRAIDFTFRQTNGIGADERDLTNNTLVRLEVNDGSLTRSKDYYIKKDETSGVVSFNSLFPTNWLVNISFKPFIPVLFYVDDVLEQVEQLDFNGGDASWQGAEPTKAGYVFKGWDKTLTDISVPTRVNAVFEEIPKPNLNINSVEFTYDEDNSFPLTEELTLPITLNNWEIEQISCKHTGNEYNITFIDNTNNVRTSVLLNVKNGYYFSEIRVGGVAILDIENGIPSDITGLESDFGLTITQGRTNTITFNDYNATKLESKTAKTGETPEFTGETPTRLGYTFNEWAPAISEARFSDTTYTATYTRSSYKVSFYDENGTTLLEEKWVNIGDTPTFTGTLPSKAGKHFARWEPTPVAVSNADQQYTAVYEINTYTIRFLDANGSAIQTETLTHGTTPVFKGTIPTKPANVFIGWSPTPYPANKNQDYTPIFESKYFEINLYQNKAEINRLDKTDYLVSVGNISGYLREESSLIEPKLIIEYEDVPNFNYVYIAKFKRYYFVQEITSVRTRLFRITLKCDVLMSYKDKILNLNCYIARNEYEYNLDIQDELLPFEYQKEVFSNYFITGTTFTNYTLAINSIYSGTTMPPQNDTINTPLASNLDSVQLGNSNFRRLGLIGHNDKPLTQLIALGNKLIQDDTLASYVVNILVYPFELTALTDSTRAKINKILLKMDDSSVELESNAILYPETNVLNPVIVRNITFTRQHNNFLDFEPYSKYELYIPFYGWIELPSYELFKENSSVNLMIIYFVNSENNSCDIVVADQDTTRVIAEVPAQIGVEIAVNTTNQERINREKSANLLNSVVGASSGALSGVVGGLFGGYMAPMYMVSGFNQFVSSITSGISKDMTLLPSANSKVGSGYASMMGERDIWTKITTSKEIEFDNYNKLVGRPLEEDRVLSALYGFTKIGGVHIENIETATRVEIEEIDNLLRQGVLLKDKTN